MKDQYDNKVPTDLVALTSGPDRFTDEEVKQIVNARWYEVIHSHGKDLAISFSESGYLEALDPSENPLGDTPIEALLVNDILKRWSEEGGFYHA